MRSQRRWVVWRYELNAKRTRWTKVPHRADGGGLAKSNDPSTWCHFETALQAYASGRYDGIGYALGDGFAGVDMDGCLSDTGTFVWGAEIIGSFNTYAEVSPGSAGVKLFVLGAKPPNTSTAKRGFGPDGSGRLEVYDHDRWFAVTGHVLDGKPAEVRDCSDVLAQLCRRHLLRDALEAVAEAVGEAQSDLRFRRCLSAMLAMNMTDAGDGSRRLYAAACRCVEHNLDDQESLRCIRDYARLQPFPTDWSDNDLLRRLRDAEKATARGKALQSERPAPLTPAFRTARQLLVAHPHLRAAVIHGLLRQGETMNLIAPSKTGKSWLVIDLALAIVTGRPWLGRFRVEPGEVLILDNELHGETTASRLPTVAMARGLTPDMWVDRLCVDNLRGRLVDVFSLRSYFEAIEPGRFKVIVLDAFYRFMPRDSDENDNGTLANIYNELDRYAARLGCAFVLIHHSSKGSQADKAVTDVGAGAGAQSRATDTHLILRAHQEEKVVVLDAAVRSWAPIEPVCLRWSFPVWSVDDQLDPTQLRTGRRVKASQLLPGVVEPEPWTLDRFVSTFIGAEPRDKKLIVAKARAASVPFNQIQTLLAIALDQRKVFPWAFPKTRAVYLATREQPLTAKAEEAS
jgi:hypothetical protein